MSVINNCVKVYICIFTCWALFYSGKLVLDINTSYQTYHVNLNLDDTDTLTLPVASCFDECLGNCLLSMNINTMNININ